MIQLISVTVVGNSFLHSEESITAEFSGNIFCQNCSSYTTTLPFLGYHRYVRVCRRCLRLVEFLNKCLDKNCSIVDKLNNEYDIINAILKGDEYTLQHFINYGGISILNYFCSLNHPSFCHVFIGIILTHMTKFELSEQSYKDLLEVFIKLTNLYIENMNKISLDTQYLLFLFQNLVIFLMNILLKAENTNITEGKEIEIIKILLNFSHLECVYKKIHRENYDNQQYIVLVSTIEKIVSKSLSEFCKKKEHQYALFQHPEVFDLFYKGLTSKNDESKKYLAKSLAYLSLRNDQYKILILKGSGKVPVKDHVNTLVNCITLDPEKFPDILSSFCNCCYTEYVKEIEEAKNDPSSFLSHSYSPKRSSFHNKASPLSISLRNSSSNYNLKHSRRRSTSSSPGSPIIKKQINLTPTNPISNLTKGLNSGHFRTLPTSPLSRNSISSNFDEFPTPPASVSVPSPSPSPSLSISTSTSPSPSSFNNDKYSLNETKNKLKTKNDLVLDENMIKELNFDPETLFTTNVLNTYLNEHQNHTSNYNLSHDLASYNTMISHVVCTLANLICQADCEEMIMENDQLIFVLCLLIEYHVKLITNSLQNKQISVVKISTSLDIARHASRALGNIALNQNNIEMLFSLCTTKQPHIISALYSLLSLNDETIQRQTLRIATPSSLSVNTNLKIPLSASPKEMTNSNNKPVSPFDTLTHDFSSLSIEKENNIFSSTIKSTGSESNRSSSMDRNSYCSLPPLFDEESINSHSHNLSRNEEHSSSKLHDKEFKRSSLQLHLNLTSPVPINNNIMMNINPDSLYFLYHIKYILRFITIVNYCKDYGCTAEIKRKATTVLNKLKVIVKNYNSNIKKLNQL
ncbi:hypothetical protein LY90DRAFT_672655 [Neocallimastix californiae]|uniref:ARM repeat-containing protein n=1 Tax=Neocallimastix californiae TaxID=1754190 RepID=A0A1Y2BTX8_9FUNG|nr:hypothetical protein LY90DRAFT_672655 [Neocallimastix californiae]|eukprot:ORY38087.1 hypothetical protein LY90DRAFT_672655 [Neocallimastix californiae]